MSYHEDMPQAALDKAPRQHRFRRAVNPARLHLTERDESAVRLVARLRLASADQLAEHVGGSDAHFRRRLRKLYDHGYLDRPDGQVTNAFALGVTIYALGQRAAEWLTEKEGFPIGHLDWQRKNAELGSTQLAHTLGTAAAMIEFLRDTTHPDRVTRYGEITLLDHFDLLPLLPLAQQATKNPFTLHLSVAIQDDFGRPLKTVDGKSAMRNFPLRPDRLFRIQLASEHVNGALENETGKKPGQRRSFENGSAWLGQAMRYWHAFESKIFETAWDFKHLRIFTIASDQTHIDLLRRRAVQNLPRPSTKMYLFSTIEEMSRTGALADCWQTIAGERVSPLD